ncbi:MAG: hypothetical protein KBB54_03900 [Candidatus Pacebacteria bacterium]|nr:hypothetical protein [Candidatus Paceibacterota bacterium]MBP9818805.1 hypothetical protein [Candidatus Paceibacterota bacterium]
MPVVFEDEKFSFDTDNTRAAQYDRKVKERASPAHQAIMIFFALLCIAGAYYLPKVINPPKEEKIVYFEDITEARMRLIPEKDREAYISRLPSRGSKGN